MTEKKKIGKYEILKELGRGAMGIVYEGKDPDIGRKVAIKTIRFDVLDRKADQDEAQKRFMREARSAGNLSHPNIVTIYDVGQDKGLTYIAMEYIEGEDLEQMIAEGRRLPLESAISLIEQIGEALDFAHRHGIIHRDIKPGNILIDAEGRPRLLDFGIARVSNSTMTKTNMVMGTPYYMAPEQISGKAVDYRADLFSLGAILYEMLTLTKPFPGENMTTVIYRILNENPPEPRAYDKKLPAGLDYVVKKALAKNPAQRYQSCRELSDDLRNSSAFEGRTFEAAEEAQDAEAGPSPAEARQRRPLLIIVGAMMLVVIITTALVLLTKKGPQPTGFAGGGGAPPAAAPPTSSRPAAEAPKTNAEPEAAAPAATTVAPSPAVPAPTKSEGTSRRGPDDAVRTEKARIASSIEDRLQLVRTAFQREMYGKCIEEARIILAMDPANAEAKRYLDMANMKYAPGQLQSMLINYVEATRAGTLAGFYEMIGTSGFNAEIRAEMTSLMTSFDQFQVSVSNVDTQIVDNLDGSYRGEMTFSEIFTARSRARNTRVVISEGRIKWDIIQVDSSWRLRKITHLTSPE